MAGTPHTHTHARVLGGLAPAHRSSRLRAHSRLRPRSLEQHQREHFEALQRLKSKFLAEKKDFQQSANSKVQVLQAQAEQEAVTCLTKHSSQIKNENRRLRNKLLALMSNNKQLQRGENSLQEQNDELRRQIELNAELVRLVDTKQAMASASRF